MALLPFRTSVKGPAPKVHTDDENDVVAEALLYFRANVLFASFEIEGPADRLLIYLTFYISQCLDRLDKKGKTKEGMYFFLSISQTIESTRASNTAL